MTPYRDLLAIHGNISGDDSIEVQSRIIALTRMGVPVRNIMLALRWLCPPSVALSEIQIEMEKLLRNEYDV